MNDVANIFRFVTETYWLHRRLCATIRSQVAVMNDLELGTAERGNESVANTCSATGVYQSRCRCAVRTAFAAGDPFTVCPVCSCSVEWQFLGGTSAP